MKTDRKQKYISVYVRNAQEGPACYYRIVQYIKRIHGYRFKINNALSISEFRRNLNMKSGFIKNLYQAWLLAKVSARRFACLAYDLLHRPECVIISREMVPRYELCLLSLMADQLTKNTYTIWDFDDDLYAFGEISRRESKFLEKNSDKIIVTHNYLRSLLPEDIQQKTVLLPTTDGLCSRNFYRASLSRRLKNIQDRITIVWVGTSNNLSNLDLAVEGLNEAAAIILKETSRKVVLKVLCNIPYKTDETEYEALSVKSYRWTRGRAIKMLMESHIGIMPLRRSEISRGKGAFKLVQYLSCGVPVIASPEGYNSSVVENNCGILADSRWEWRKALLQITKDQNTWLCYSQAARKCYEEKYGFEDNLSVWNQMIGEIGREKD